VVEGFQKIRPNAPVKAVAWTRPGTAPASAPAAATNASAAKK